MKVWASLTGTAREQASRTSTRFHLDPVRWYGTPEPVPCLPQLADATWRDRQVRIEYVRCGEAAQRTVSPLGLVLAAGVWYVVGLRDGRRRSYRVSRIRSVELLDAAAIRPDGFDLAADWEAARRDFETEDAAVEVTLRVHARALPRLRRMVPVRGQATIPLTATGVVELTVPFEHEDWGCEAVLSLGSAAEVLGPPDFRTRIAAEACALGARYAADDLAMSR
jgi:predicted DNA-binding transcriptional regulator YafY